MAEASHPLGIIPGPGLSKRDVDYAISNALTIVLGLSFKNDEPSRRELISALILVSCVSSVQEKLPVAPES